MSLRSWQVAAMLPATLTMGLLAGVFGVDSHSIMRGLTQDRRRDLRRRLPSHRRGQHQPGLHAHVRGRLVLTGIAGVLYLRDDDRTMLRWVAHPCSERRSQPRGRLSPLSALVAMVSLMTGDRDPASRRSTATSDPRPQTHQKEIRNGIGACS